MCLPFQIFNLQQIEVHCTHVSFYIKYAKKYPQNEAEKEKVNKCRFYSVGFCLSAVCHDADLPSLSTVARPRIATSVLNTGT